MSAIQSFVRRLQLFQVIFAPSWCANIDSQCENALQTNRGLSIYECLFVSSTRRKERIHKRRGAVPPKNKFVTLDVTRLKNRGVPKRVFRKHPFDVNFKDRKRSLENKDNSTEKKILPFVTQYHPALPNLKNNYTYEENGTLFKINCTWKKFSGATHTIICDSTLTIAR